MIRCHDDFNRKTYTATVEVVGKRDVSTFCFAFLRKLIKVYIEYCLYKDYWIVGSYIEILQLF